MIYITYLLALFTFTIYSYSQIDLNLTLSSNSLYQYFQQQLIYIGYFNRPLSTIIYIILLFLFFIFYFLFLWLVKQKKLTQLNILWLIIGSSIILFFSYPAFSHDIFNYMFDARIVTKYFSNPYFFSAQNFPSDLWIRFMHWTHRTYPYGPTWLLLTLPFSFLGFGKFVLTLFNFKLMFMLFHLGNIFFIYKILHKISPRNALLGITFYAFNPLVIIESIVSPHNEVVMLFFLLLAIYLTLKKKNDWLIFGNLLLSAGVKFATLFLLPIFVLSGKITKKFEFIGFLRLIFLFLIPILIVEILYREPYPWYFILPVGVAALVVENNKVIILTIGITLGAMLRYTPYLYQGDYSHKVVNMQNLLFIMPIVLIALLLVLFELKKRLKLPMV